MLQFTFQNLRAFYGPWPCGLGLTMGTMPAAKPKPVRNKVGTSLFGFSCESLVFFYKKEWIALSLFLKEWIIFLVFFKKSEKSERVKEQKSKEGKSKEGKSKEQNSKLATLISHFLALQQRQKVIWVKKVICSFCSSHSF